MEQPTTALIYTPLAVGAEIGAIDNGTEMYVCGVWCSNLNHNRATVLFLWWLVRAINRVVAFHVLISVYISIVPWRSRIKL